jgi:zinc protease
MILKKRKILSPLAALIFLLLWTSLTAGCLYAATPYKKIVLSNKLVLLVAEEHSLPFATFQLLIDSGSRRDPAGKEGLAYLTARGLLLGTSKHTISSLNKELDFMGTVLDASSGRDFATLHLQVLKKNLYRGFDLFMEVLTQPTFPEKEVKKEVREVLGNIKSDEDDPGIVAEKAFRKSLFLTSPYAHPAEGTKESLPGITSEELVQFYRMYYHPNNSILAIVGDITLEEIKSNIIPRLQKWPMGKIPEKPFKTLFAAGPKTIKIDREITQANIILGSRGVSRGNPDYYTLSVMNYILGGGGFASRLMEEIRNKRGLAYSVESFFKIVLQTKNSSAREAISLALTQMKQIQKAPVSAKELEGAKKYLIGSFPRRLDTQGKLSSFLVQVEYYGLGLDYPEKYPSLIRSVTREDVLRAAKNYLHPENYILLVVADLKKAGL